MKIRHIDITTLTNDPSHFGTLDLLLTAKSFDLQAIRKRYLASKASGSGRTGSVTRREPSQGGVVAATLEGNRLTQQNIVWRTTEPRGIDWQPQALTLAADRTVFIIDAAGNKQTINHPWLSYIHTVAWSPHAAKRLLVSSSGLDLLQVYFGDSLAWEWLAWENGFNQGFDTAANKPILLTRDRKQAEAWAAAGQHYTLIDSPNNSHLPTAMRAAFINSSVFDAQEPGYVLATFFHAGKVFRINEQTGEASVVMTDLQHPHGGRRFGAQFMATSTATGEVVLQDEKEQTRYSMADLPGKPDYLVGKEWVQNTITTDTEWIVIDSNRTAFIRIDPLAGRYCIVPYPDSWAVQDGVPGQLTPEQVLTLQQLT